MLVLISMFFIIDLENEVEFLQCLLLHCHSLLLLSFLYFVNFGEFTHGMGGHCTSIQDPLQILLSKEMLLQFEGAIEGHD